MGLILLCSIFHIFTSFAQAEEISFESDVRFKKNEQISFSDLKSGDALKLLPGENVLITTKAGLPILVYSSQSEKAKLLITNANLESALQEQLRPTLEKSTNEVIDALRKTESFIQKRDYAQALATITPLREKYKTISAVLFMSGTVSYLMNNKSSAIEELQKGLLLDPENISAKKLLSQLKGSL